MTNDVHKRLYGLLVATLGYIMLLHIEHLPIWVVVFSICFGVWRLRIAFDQAKPVKLTMLAPLTIAIGVGILMTYKGLIYRDSAVTMLLIMLMLKLLEAKSKRDVTLISILGYLLTGATFLFSQTIITFLLTIPAVILLTTILIQLVRQSPKKTEVQSIKIASKMLIQATPLMLVLFLLFPRISQPLWGGSISPSTLNTTGLSNAIELNQISQAVKNGSVAFRVKFKGKVPDQSQLYWRGPVFWQINQQRWEVLNKNIHLPHESLITQGTPIEYSVTMEPNYHHWLVLLDMPRKAPINASMSADRTVLAKKPTNTRIRYEAQSWPEYRLGIENLSKSARHLSLQLESANPKTVALGRQWSNLEPVEAVKTALHLFQNGGFSYTLNPPTVGKHAIDDFLFSSRRGFCEHYATSFVYLMRAAGVPARVVTGYQGGEMNDDYLIVRQSNAHAWAEIWLENQGWVRIDPTQTVAPDRVEQGIAAAIENSLADNSTDTPENVELGVSTEIDHLPIQERLKQHPFLYQSFLKWDGIENGWNQWVIDYNQHQQKALLSQLTDKTVTLSTVAIFLAIGLLIAGLVTTVILAMNKPSDINKAQQLYNKFLKKLNPYKLTPYAYETTTDFAQRAAKKLPHNKSELLAIASLYNKLAYSRYSTISDNSLYTTFANMIHQFKPTRD